MYLDLSKPFQLEKDKVLKNPPSWETVSTGGWVVNGQQTIPQLSGGGLYTYAHADKTNGLFLYDGKLNPAVNANSNDRSLKSQAVSYAIEKNEWKLEDSWSNPETDEGIKSAKISRYSRGTPVDVPGENKAFYVGGARVWEFRKKYDWYYPDDIQLAEISFDKKLDKKVGFSVFAI